jgi:hypothetical protein
MLNWRIRHLYNALDQSGIEYEMTGVILVTFTPKS